MNWARDVTRLGTQITRLAFVTILRVRWAAAAWRSTCTRTIFISIPNRPSPAECRRVPIPGRHKRNRMHDLNIHADLKVMIMLA